MKTIQPSAIRRQESFAGHWGSLKSSTWWWPSCLEAWHSEMWSSLFLRWARAVFCSSLISQGGKIPKYWSQGEFGMCWCIWPCVACVCVWYVCMWCVWHIWPCVACISVCSVSACSLCLCVVCLACLLYMTVYGMCVCVWRGLWDLGRGVSVNLCVYMFVAGQGTTQWSHAH